MTILEGLTMIDNARLPHPEWEFVRSSHDLKKFYDTEDYVGWTIRTVEVENAPWKNVYANWVAKIDIPAKVDELQKEQKGNAVFVVYPSWKWNKGGTVLIEGDQVIIEAVADAVVELMRHGRVDVRYVFEGNELKQVDGNKDLLNDIDIQNILMAKKHISVDNIILEWGVTTQNKFIFYRIEDIREAARLLLEKYAA